VFTQPFLYFTQQPQCVLAILNCFGFRKQDSANGKKGKDGWMNPEKKTVPISLHQSKARMKL